MSMNLESAISEEAKVRETLNRVFSGDEIYQRNLFGEEGLKETLDKIFSLIRQGKPLYNRWTQKVGDKERHLAVPKKPFKEFLEIYLLGFIKQMTVHEKCHGGEVGWSPKKSLETHLPCSSVLSFDLRKAFENTSYEKICELFCRIISSHFSPDEREYIAEVLASLCTVRYQDKRGLPQGSPCSMALFNRVLHSLDDELSRKSEERGLRYTRWVDDLTISSPTYKELEFFLGAVEITTSGFPVSREKVFFQVASEGDIYLLGYKIRDGQLLKNTRGEKERNKVKPLNFLEYFGENRTRSYDPWK